MIGNCAVCGKENIEVFVVSSACGAMSFAYCKDCLRAGAEPYSQLVLYVACSSARCDEEVSEWFKPVIDWTLNHLDISREQFWEDVGKVEF